MIGEVLRVARIANDMSIKEVSNKANASVSYITELEKNKRTNPSTEFLKKICDVYALKVSDFCALDEYHNSLVGTKEQLQVYKLLLIEILKTLEKNDSKVL